MLVGVVLGLLAVLKILDMGFYAALDRPFNPVIDWGYFGSAVGAAARLDRPPRRHRPWSLAVLLAVALLVLIPLAVLRLTRLLGRHRTPSDPGRRALGVVWVCCAVLGVQIAPGAPVASTSAAAPRLRPARRLVRAEHPGPADVRAGGHRSIPAATPPPATC